jgi:hypothetical protein
MSVDRERVAAALPSYEIGEEIGRGALGIVREGRHRRLDRQVAIKQLPPSLSGDPSVRERFAAEARVLASLDHPHIVPVFDFVEADGLCLLVMEKLPGGTVWSRFTILRTGPGHLLGPAGGARPRSSPPGHQTREPAVRLERKPEGCRLRHRQGGG